jgi:hypothetical protein
LRVSFLTLSKIENINERGIYTDLVRELSPTELTRQDNIYLLKVKTGVKPLIFCKITL